MWIWCWWPVTITDPMNRLVTGLDRENFQVYEGKEAQEIKHFSSEDAPVSLGVIFDMSGSMSSKIERAREAVIEFFKTANPQDERRKSGLFPASVYRAN
jgi:Ca-activated chloride channel family protein